MKSELDGILSALEKLYSGRYVAFSELVRFQNEYLNDSHCMQLDESTNDGRKWLNILQDVRKLRRNRLKAFLGLDFEKYRKLNKIEKYLYQREKINKDFVAKEQKKPYEIEGNRLDPQQIAAVVACEDAELILASAGSGKSASLLAKVNYIINELGMPADEVLVIAFTRKVVEELKERMKGSGVEICTFHSFGNKIIKESEMGKDKRLILEGILEEIVEKVLSKWLAEEKIKKEELKRFGDLESLRKLVAKCLQLQKNEQIQLAQLKDRIETVEDLPERERMLKFYTWYEKIYNIYAKYLEAKRLFDFSDMLILATKEIENMKLSYKYVLVDEVQDLSKSKSLLLQAILKQSPAAKLFAVGDDWQSIYRFAGSNLGVLKDFEKTFNKYTFKGVIRRTYRFGQPTAWVSEYFIRKNPHQSKKKVQTYKKEKTPIEIEITGGQKGMPVDYDAVNRKLQEIFGKIGMELFEKRVQVISRYNRDIYRLVDTKSKKFKNAKIVDEREDGIIMQWYIEKAKRWLEMAFCSMHKSKGITRDIVFVVNMNEGEKGMPSTRADDPILRLMLAKPDKYPLAEERRLFYVAITRATEKTIIVSEKKKISRFVREIAKNLGGKAAEIL